MRVRRAPESEAASLLTIPVLHHSEEIGWGDSCHVHYIEMLTNNLSAWTSGLPSAGRGTLGFRAPRGTGGRDAPPRFPEALRLGAIDFRGLSA